MPHLLTEEEKLTLQSMSVRDNLGDDNSKDSSYLAHLVLRLANHIVSLEDNLEKHSHIGRLL